MHQAAESPALAPQSLTLAVIGPTATGKTRLALELARLIGGEILSADMGQLYRLLDAGTAKPEGRWTERPALGRYYEVEGVPYHLVDILDPSETTDAGSYARRARPVLADIRRRGRIPIVAGGTGFYVRALLEGLDEMPTGDPELRRRLAERGPAWVASELKRRDPVSAARIPERNAARMLRALEVLELTGRPISSFWTRPSAGADVRYVGLRWPPEDLRRRIQERAEAMFPKMLAEVRALVPARYEGREPGFRCLGYPQALACARGDLAEAEALEAMILATNAYARRQRTWFTRQTSAAWLPPGAGAPEALEALRWNA